MNSIIENRIDSAENIGMEGDGSAENLVPNNNINRLINAFYDDESIPALDSEFEVSLSTYLIKNIAAKYDLKILV